MATAHQASPRNGRFEHLDMVRGLAALLVVLGHVRAMVFLDLQTVTSGRLVAMPLYIVTGLGHQAVILFFALSGFLVGGRAMVEIGKGTSQARDYTIHRFARLWTVMIPALVVTAGLDWLGRQLLGSPGYSNEFNSMMAMGPGVDFASSSGIFVFIGNLLFLQTIAAPTFGTNVPLWSLANEFWYYFMVPIAWLALAGRSKITVRAAALVIAIIAIALFPLPLVILGLIWVFGTATYRLKSWIAKLRPVPFLVYGGCAVAAIAAAFLLALDLYRFCAGRLRA